MLVVSSMSIDDSTKEGAPSLFVSMLLVPDDCGLEFIIFLDAPDFRRDFAPTLEEEPAFLALWNFSGVAYALSSPRTRFSLIIYESFASVACGVNASNIKNARCVIESLMVECDIDAAITVYKEENRSIAVVILCVG